MLWLWLGTCALTAVPQLHQLLHQDAQQSTHTCFITQLQHQPLLAGGVSVTTAALPAASLEWVWHAPFQFLHPCEYRLPSGRAPPAALPTNGIAG